VSILAENIPPTDAIQKTAIPNIFAVTAGPNSPNPSGLLASEGMKRFLDFVAMNFEYVVVDTPPVGPVADALIIGSQIDGVVLTVRGGRTPREQVTRTRDKLIRANVKILGVLINNLEEDTPGYGRYYYYGKSYGDTPRTYGEPPRAAGAKS
jgi:capsular exopolysaccharide synthesis family protein